MQSKLSFHPKLVAVLDVVLNLVFLWWLKQISSWWVIGVWIFFRLAIWGAFMRLIYYPAELKRWRHISALFLLSFGSLFFLLFIEWNMAWYLMGAVFTFFSFFSFWLLPSSNLLTSFHKPHLRWRFLMSVVGLAGIFQGVGAVTSFQVVDTLSPWLWIAGASFFSTLVAGWWWEEYGVELNNKYWLWVLFWFILMLEFLWVVELLPLGYLTSSFLIIWCWYILWLLVRFHLTPEGINWRKQAYFLSANTLMFLVFLLFIARWK